MKREGHLIERVAEMDNLLLAFYKAQKGKSGKKEVCAYRSCLQDNLLRMRNGLLTGEAAVGRYHTFTIYDPKERQIYAAAFEERVLHHALMNVCHPYFEKHLIDDTYATRRGKGTYAALERAHKSIAHYQYVAKLDVRKYFDSINHDILKEQLSRLFKDPLLVKVFNKILDACHGSCPDVGLPIGNLTSQYFANHYLSVLDHYVKEQAQVVSYVRYMDDMLLFADDRQSLKRQVGMVDMYLRSNLKLHIKPPIIVSTDQGVSFLGYRLQGHRIGLNSRSRNRYKRKMNLYGRLLETGRWNQEDYRVHVQPLNAFTAHAYSKKFRTRVIKSQAAGLEPRESWWQLEQQCQELPRFESQQQHSLEPQQQSWFPCGFGPQLMDSK